MEWSESVYRATKVEARDLAAANLDGHLEIILDANISLEDDKLELTLKKCL